MRRANLSVVLGCAAATLVALVACATKSPRPDELGDCTPIGDASCTTNPGGGMGSTAEGGSDAPVDALGDVSACGTADTVVTTITANVNCVPCITNLCCQADLLCVGACFSLLQCLVPCAVGDQVCIGTCENNNPTGVTPYNDFQVCLAQNCSPQCPTLPTAAPGDF